MSNVKAQSSNEVQISKFKRKHFDIKTFGIPLTFEF